MGVRQWIGQALDALATSFGIDRAKKDDPGWTKIVSLYGEPSAERVLSSFQQYAEHGYAGNSVVFGVVLARMGLFTEARFRWRDLDTKKLSRTADLNVLERPWPNGTTGELLARMEQDASLAGNAYIRHAGDRLERLRPDWVTIVSRLTVDVFGRELREILGYAYDPTGDPDRDIEYYDVSEVAHWSPIPDPLANWRGMSWLTPVLREINADIAMTKHRDAFFRNSATPNVVIKYQGRMTPERIAKVRDAVQARHGGPEKAGGTMVLDEGADLSILGASMRDADFDAIQAAGENRISVAGGVPAIVAGLKEGLSAAGWSMYGSAMRRFADVTIRPLWRSACAALSTLVEVPDGKELWYDTTDITALQPGEQDAAQVFQLKAATASTLITAGYEPDSVILAVEAGDMTLLVHSGRYSVQLLPPGADGPPPGPGRPPLARAKYATPTTGDDRLKHHWLHSSEGLSKWVDHPHPWTALRDHLAHHVSPGRADEIASAWYIEHFGHPPNKGKGKGRT